MMADRDLQQVSKIDGQTERRLLQPRHLERLDDLSGAGDQGRAKTVVLIRSYLKYSDGTEREIQSCTFVKPILNLYEGYGFLTMDMDFMDPLDEDLRVAFYLLRDFFSVKHSVNYLPEEIEQGYYTDGDGRELLVYYPILEVMISPLGREQEYQLHAFNVLYYALTPNHLNAHPTVLRLLCSTDFFAIADELAPIDYEQIEQEIEQELNEEMGYPIDLQS